MIPENFHQENQLQSTLEKFFQEFRISSMLTKANCRKDAGVPVSIIFRLLFSLLFYGKSLPRAMSAGLFPEAGGKDVVYRFLNSYRSNWRKFLWLLSSAVILKVVWPLTNHDRQAVLIVDDSLFKRARSKKVELLSRVHDHTTNSYVRGFRLLTLGWSDGNSFIPLAFSLLSSSNPKNRFAEATADLDKRTIGHRRRCEAVMKSPDVLISLLRQAKTLGIPGCHVLFDSWFSSPVLLARIYSLGYKAVAMLKNTPKVFYRYNGKLLTLSQLFTVVKKRRGRAKILASISVELSSKKRIWGTSYCPHRFC